MLSIRELESLRTKEELINYFKAMGQSITEEEIERLKKSYEQAQENGNALTMQQLDEVAGGIALIERSFSWLRGKKEKFYSNSTEEKKFFGVISQIFHGNITGFPPEREHENTVRESRPENSTTTTTTTTGTGLAKQHQDDAEQMQTGSEHITFHEHSFLGFGYGKEVTIEDSHARALFARETPQHFVDMNHPDVQALVHTYTDRKIQKYATLIQESGQNTFGTYTDHLISQYSQKIEYFNDMHNGKISLTRADLNHIFNKIYHKDGLAESLIHITAEKFFNCNSGLIHRVGLDKVDKLEVQEINGQNLLHYQIKSDGTHGVEERLDSLNRKGSKCILSTNAGKVNFLTSEAVCHITGALKNKNLGGRMDICGAEFKKVAEGVFSYVDTMDETVVSKSTGEYLFTVKEGKVNGMPFRGTEFIAEQLKEIKVGKTREIAGAIFKKEAGNVFSYVAHDGKTVLINKKCRLFLINGTVQFFTRESTKIVPELLKDKETGYTITIAGIKFKKESEDVFSYVNKDNLNVVINSEGKTLFTWNNNYVNTEVKTEIKNSGGKVLFKVKEGKVDFIYNKGIEFMVDLLKDKAPGYTITIAGAIFKKEAGNVFSYVAHCGKTVLINKKRILYLSEGRVKFPYYSSRKNQKIVRDLLKGMLPGDKITIAGVEFRKEAVDVLSYVDIDNDTLVMDSKGNFLFWANEGKVGICFHDGAKFVVDLLKGNKPGDPIKIGNGTFTKLADDVFSYVDKNNDTVVMNSECGDLFRVEEGKVGICFHDGAKFVADLLKYKAPGDTITIAGAEFRKLAEGVFSYVDKNNDTVVMNSEGKIVCKLGQAIKLPEKMDNEDFTNIKGEQGELLVINSENEVLACFNRYGKVGYFNIDWVNRKLRDLPKITSEERGKEREIVNNILRGLFKPNITDEGITLLQALNTVPKNELKFKLAEIAQEIGSVYHGLHNVYIDGDGMFCANGHKFKKVELEIKEGHRYLHFSEKIIEEESQHETKTSEHIAGEINNKELRSKLTEVEEAIEDKRKAIKEADEALLPLNAKMNELIAELDQAVTCEEENKIFGKIIASIIDIDPESTAQIIEKIKERNKLIDERHKKYEEVLQKMSYYSENCVRLKKHSDIEPTKNRTNGLHIQLREIGKEYNQKIEELYKEIKEKINTVCAQKKKESIKLEEELDALKAERDSLTEQLEQQDEITEPGELYYQLDDSNAIGLISDGNRVLEITEETSKYIASKIANLGVPVNSIIKLGVAEFTKVAEDAFSYVDTNNDTVVMNSEGKKLYSIQW